MAKNTLNIGKISEGFVLDHIEAGKSMDIYKYLKLDMQCANYINKARNTVKKMNTNRSAITKIFDQIRSEFTGMENSVDPNKTGSIPYQIQQERNAYAARKREEEERRRREEIIRQQREQALCRYKQDVEDDFKRQFNVYTTNATNELTKLNSGLTLENYEAQCKTIREYPVTLPDVRQLKVQLSKLLGDFVQFRLRYLLIK